MHAHEHYHLMALNNRLAKEFSLFIVRLSILNVMTLYMVS